MSAPSGGAATGEDRPSSNWTHERTVGKLRLLVTFLTWGAWLAVVVGIAAVISVASSASESGSRSGSLILQQITMQLAWSLIAVGVLGTGAGMLRIQLLRLELDAPDGHTD